MESARPGALVGATGSRATAGVAVERDGTALRSPAGAGVRHVDARVGVPCAAGEGGTWAPLAGVIAGSAAGNPLSAHRVPWRRIPSPSRKPGWG